MDDERSSTAAESIAKSVERVSDSKGLQAIGHGIGWGLGALAMALIFISFTLPNVMTHWDGHVVPQSKCFDLKEIAGKIYKVNTCTGDAQPLVETPAPASAAASAKS